MHAGLRPSDPTSRSTPCPPEYRERFSGQRGYQPRFWIWRPSFERQRDFNPPEQRAAQRTLQSCRRFCHNLSTASDYTPVSPVSRGRSAYPLPDECSDLFLFRRIRPHDNCQFVIRDLELTHKIPANVGGGKRAFEMVRNCMIGSIYGVRTKICFVSAKKLRAVIARSGARGAAVYCCETVRSHQLHSHVPSRVVYQITFGCAPETLILSCSAVL